MKLYCEFLHICRIVKGCVLRCVIWCVAGLTLFPSVGADAQNAATMKKSLTAFFANYTNDAYSTREKAKVEDIIINREEKHMHVYLSEPFLGQPFTPETIQRIYRSTAEQLPSPYNTYTLTIYANGTPIDQLLPLTLMNTRPENRVYPFVQAQGKPWVSCLSRPNSITSALQGRHLCLWASHGKYFSQKKGEWQWQRPRLYCTAEDLFTQTIVLPYLIPMLENAGAVVFTPRERNWQKQEIIVDNDQPTIGGLYQETEGKHHWHDADTGFAYVRPYYIEKQNPFKDGTCRKVTATQNPDNASTVTWTPLIQQEGDYAVYVSYKTLENSVDDALYRVMHEGVATDFRVNQTMGSGTWVYLGTFHFGAGTSADNAVTLFNVSEGNGVVTADAVRFGGGMGNVLRYDEKTPDQKSGSRLPRFLECARYYAQWAGMPYKVYSVKESMDDYGDDINTRAKMENFLARGSCYYPADETYVPVDSGLAVPLELSLGVHSDAGLRKDSTLIGTLGIYTTGFYDGVTAAGLSRLTCRDLADIVMTNVCADLRRHVGTWNRRAMYDRNYGESREPQIPCMILETLSHQNWADLCLGHDPYFKFLLARAIYKGVLQYISTVHGITGTVVQPLPVCNLAAEVSNDGGSVTLSWQPQEDITSASATPTHYIIYARPQGRGYDNGTLIDASQTEYHIDIQPGTLYHFRVAAANAGGSSLLSDEVCAYYGGAETARLMLVDGFQRVAGPLPIDNEEQNGFDMSTEPGVVDNRMPGYCGYQLFFEKTGYGKEGPNGTGYSGSELEGMILAGNTHDYTSRHAEDILAGGIYTISSCSRGALNRLSLDNYRMLDVIMGAQKNDGYSLRSYKTFTPEMCKTLIQFAQRGGNLLLSGAFVGSDMQAETERQFTSQLFKYQYQGSIPTDSLCQIQGMNVTGEFHNQPNEENYWIRQADMLQATEGAFSAMLYGGINTSAAVAYEGADYHTISFGFPLECIKDAETRRGIFSASIRFLLGQ